jgi:hypothetical protein
MLNKDEDLRRTWRPSMLEEVQGMRSTTALEKLDRTTAAEKIEPGEMTVTPHVWAHTTKEEEVAAQYWWTL